MKFILYLYVIPCYLIGLVFWGFNMEYYFSKATQYERNRLNLVVALAPVGLPILTAIMLGKILAEEHRGNHKERKKTCAIRFGFCGPQE